MAASWGKILTAPAEAANDSSFDELQDRSERAIGNIREHKRMDKKLPCGHIHFDMVEAMEAEHAKGNVTYRFVRTFAKQVFLASTAAGIISGLVGAALPYLIKGHNTAKIESSAPDVEPPQSLAMRGAP